MIEAEDWRRHEQRLGVTITGEKNGAYARRAHRIRTALDKKRFVLHAQPILNLRTRRIASCELLIRMVSESGELILPDEFLPVAERWSLVTDTDYWVLGEAIRLAQDGRVAINLSASSVGDPRIIATVREAIAQGLDPRRLVFEVTESAVMTDFTAMLSFVSALTALGCELSLDDFGTGVGPVTYVKHLPVRYLKIDIELVRAVNTDAGGREIVRSIVMITHALGKETIAEGVEDAEVLHTLRELGVDYAQGFHLGRPTPLAPSEVVPERAAA